MTHYLITLGVSGEGNSTETYWKFLIDLSALILGLGSSWCVGCTRAHTHTHTCHAPRILVLLLVFRKFTVGRFPVAEQQNIQYSIKPVGDTVCQNFSTLFFSIS